MTGTKEGIVLAARSEERSGDNRDQKPAAKSVAGARERETSSRQPATCHLIGPDISMLNIIYVTAGLVTAHSQCSGACVLDIARIQILDALFSDGIPQ